MRAPSLHETVGVSRPRLEIDLAAIATNTHRFARHTQATVMAVVKADGFGHGAVQVAHTALANGAGWLGVTSLDEALALRDAGIGAPILSWLNPVDLDAESAARYRIDLAVPSIVHLDRVLAGAARARRSIRIHLHLDTGMARDGAAPGEWDDLFGHARRAERAGHVQVLGVMGHLPCADEPGHPTTAAGRHALLRGVDLARAKGLRPTMRHLAATAATFTAPDTHLDMVRVGAGLVGIDPSGTTPLAQPMQLTAPVTQIRDVSAGTGVGYGHTYITDRPTRLGLIPVGYGDGLPRVASNRAAVWIDGQRLPIRGRISMDQIVVDLGDAALAPSATAVIFGDGGNGEPTVADWARWSDTLPHEIVTGLGARLERVTT